MYSMREQIHRLNLFEFVSEFPEPRDVMCKSFRIAGNIDHPVRLESSDSSHHFAAGTGTRRIKHEQVRYPPRVKYFVHAAPRIFGQEERILYAIVGSIPFCGFDGCFHNFNAGKLFHPRSKREGKGSDTAEQI